MDSSIPIFEGPLAIIDVLGFRNLVKQRCLKEFITSYARVITGIQSASNTLESNLEIMVYSDTIAIKPADNSEESFHKMIKTLKLSLSTMFHSIGGGDCIPLRGAISYGEFAWYKGDIQTQVMNRVPLLASDVNFIVGQPIVDVHDHEVDQEWMGISMNEDTSKQLFDTYPKAMQSLIHSNCLIQTDIPLKRGRYAKSYAINNVTRGVIELHLSSFVTEIEKQSLKPESNKYIHKYFNTYDFYRYIVREKLYHPIYSCEIEEDILSLEEYDERINRLRSIFLNKDC